MGIIKKKCLIILITQKKFVTYLLKFFYLCLHHILIFISWFVQIKLSLKTSIL